MTNPVVHGNDLTHFYTDPGDEPKSHASSRCPKAKEGGERHPSPARGWLCSTCIDVDPTRAHTTLSRTDEGGWVEGRTAPGREGDAKPRPGYRAPRAEQLPIPTATGRFETVPNGFGGTTTRRRQPEQPPSDQPRNANQYAGTCVRCSGRVEAQEGIRLKVNGRWTVEHIGECPPQATAPTNTYEPQAGDVHLIDGTYYRVHIGQRSGRPYAVKANILTHAVWDGDRIVKPGEVEWELAKGAIYRLSETTKASPAESAAFGHLVGRCCFCSTKIDTPESTTAGYGPVCADKRGLPWGSTITTTTQGRNA